MTRQRLPNRRPSASVTTAGADGRGGRFSKNQGARKPVASSRVFKPELKFAKI